MHLALNLKFDGVYIPSFNKKINFTYNKRVKNFRIIGSAHNLAEIRIKEKQGVDCIFLSPLFKVIKSNKFLGIKHMKVITVLFIMCKENTFITNTLEI